MNTVNTVSNRFEPAVSRKTLALVSGTFWLIGGCAVLLRAYTMVSEFTLAAIGILTLGLVIGSLKSHFVLSKVAKRNIERIKKLSPHKKKICVFAFQAPLSYLLVAIMIGGGVALRTYFGPSTNLAALYVGIGAALIVSGMQYFKGAGDIAASSAESTNS